MKDGVVTRATGVVRSNGEAFGAERDAKAFQPSPAWPMTEVPLAEAVFSASA